MTTKRSWRARKIDGNARSLIEAAERMGFKVHPTNGDWDLTAQIGDCTELWECKNGRGRVTERQARLKEKGFLIWTVRTVDDLLSARARMLGYVCLTHPEARR